MWTPYVTLSVFLVLCTLATVQAIGQASCVSFSPASGASSFSVVSSGHAAPVLVSSDDWPGVQRAANDFVNDIQRVTGVLPALSNYTGATSGSGGNAVAPIIVGTLGQSSLIAQVVNNTGLDVSSIEGQWEAFFTREVRNPLPGISSAYVMIGADKRGTIYAMYDHSEQFGVSPWYWWADVPTTQNADLYVSPDGCYHGAPTVKYRGIFLNDEQPALQNWAMEKYTNGTGSAATDSPFQSPFYTLLFELMLRLKANYLWPAMWSSGFYVDDPLNPYYADLYGIVMGTSHEEPMTRSTPVEWDLYGTGPWDYSVNNATIYPFWVQGAERSKNYETLYTVGMRGAGDLPLAEGQNIQLLEQVVSDQRGILENVFNGTGKTITEIPQMWCLYKEVQGYYEDGMTVPDDITLLWTDDNWGNIRRFPVQSEMNRTGGAGVYYHFDYVGDPRNFKWITTSQISKTYEQMSLAVDREATRIWIVNVGDLKPYEMDIEFFITYGWNSSVWNLDNLDSFVTTWAEREFDVPISTALQITDIVGNLTRVNARRTPELMNSTVYTLTDYRETENVLAEWQSLVQQSTNIYNSLSAAYQPAFYELLHHAVLASANLNTMWIYAGTNNLLASQGRFATNNYADLVQQLFETDFDYEYQYHTLLDGKWDHMMDQTHVVYVYWQEPTTNTMPMVTRMQTRKQNIAGVMRIVPEGTMGVWPGDNQYNCALGYSCPNPTVTLDPYIPVGNRYVDVGAGGPAPFTWTATSNVSWLHVSQSSGSIDPTDLETRVYVTTDWSQFSEVGYGQITFNATTTEPPTPGQTLLSVPVYFVANNTSPAAGFSGFVEGDGGISIEAAHTTRNTSVAGVTWTEIPNYGKTISGITPWPRTGDNGGNFTAGTGPSVEYDFYNFNTIGQAGNVTITTYVSPSLNANGDDRPLGFAIGVDDEAPQSEYFIPYAVPGQLPAQWDGVDGWVADAIVAVTTNFTALPGAHTLKIWMIEPAVVVQKIVIDTGNVRASYLGPPESIVI
ncbi:glycoside hydrolase family 115 protein [Neolentinus lepideus HHB14362 ss-1]|uniref:Glycoside hydrolase family 115 protein n=1 Tax=Neolentinus lepideus HHB14362 ss-1 TaxID=1314782 RepID=A0A165PNH0_9AGAM|nr:glycoside hydrolase family 115 protein [Neolentinus lepideus HHB14362 ss-1]